MLYIADMSYGDYESNTEYWVVKDFPDTMAVARFIAHYARAMQPLLDLMAERDRQMADWSSKATVDNADERRASILRLGSEIEDARHILVDGTYFKGDEYITYVKYNRPTEGFVVRHPEFITMDQHIQNLKTQHDRGPWTFRYAKFTEACRRGEANWADWDGGNGDA